MSHLETVLRRAIVDVDPSDRQGRRVALGNVRGSMVRLLAVYDPPLSAAEIEGKIDEVDALIRAIEAEFAPMRVPASAVAPTAATLAVDESQDDSEHEALEADDEYGDLEERLGDGDDAVAEPARPARRPLPVFIALLSLAALGVGLFYLAREVSASAGGSAAAVATGPAAISAPVAETAPAGDMAPDVPVASSGPVVPPGPEGTDALEASDVSPEPASSNAAEAAPVAPAPDQTARPAATPAAVSPPPGPKAVESLVLFDGHDPGAFKSSADNPVRFEGGTAGGFVEIASSSGSNGARLVVGPGVFQRIAGRTIRVVVVARGAPDNPASSLRIAYQNGRQLSGWSDLQLGDGFQSLAMNWTVPKDRAGPDNDAILIEPGIPGDQTAAEIRSVTIDVLP